MQYIKLPNNISKQNTFERKKQELLASQSVSAVEGETNLAGQPSQLTEMDIWVQSVGGKKKGKVKGLGSLGRSVKSSSKQSTSALSREIDEMIKAQKERHKNKRMRRELDLLKKHVYNASSSNEQSSQEDNQAYENESGDDFDSVNYSGSAHDNVNDSGNQHFFYSGLQWNFIWGTTDSKRKLHLLNWDIVTRPKGEGGLGIQKCKLKNDALLSKLAWRIYKNPTTLWAALLINKYTRNTNLNTIDKHLITISSTWKNIMLG
ncbi:hypothetical protein H5410_014801 [Solanum commersonii]|uniref:Uncharacterized protein n=1 Tax=Solanum commersonii TaxID=4109 RepID=A0A9J5ZRZ1_SOLCO|nr:hypothetical protein H5410_014801 [Solanum commersonii]